MLDLNIIRFASMQKNPCSSIIILPSENSWHTVTPVIPEVNRTRLTFVLIFFQQSAEAVLYDIFKQQKLLFYKLD